MRDTSGLGISNVLISNGEHVVQTDTDGCCVIQADTETHSLIFMTVPNGFRPLSPFYQPVGSESTDLAFILDPDPTRATRHFDLAHITDTHVVVGKYPKWGGVMPSDSEKILVQDLKQLVHETSPDMIIASGDLTDRGTLAELRSFRKAVRSVKTPVFTVFGGHDGIEEATAEKSEAGFAASSPGDADSFTRHYEQILAPSYYSFDWGGRHFVIYAQEDDFFSETGQRCKENWLWEDLAMQPSTMESVLIMHTAPNLVFLQQLAVHNVTLVLHGHWHSSKVFTHNGITVAAAPPIGFGGIDTSPRGYRMVAFQEDGFRMTLNTLKQPTSLTPSPQNGKKDKSEKSLSIVWEHELPVGLHRAAPIYNGLDLLLSLQDENHSGQSGVRCIDGDSGAMKWQVHTDSSVKNSVSLGPDNLCTAVSVTGRVYCIDVRTGKIHWDLDLPGYPDRWIYTSPVISNNTVYVGAKDGYGAYDLRTGSCRWYRTFKGDAELINSWNHGDRWPCYASPQIHENLLIVLVQRRGILAVSMDDGKPVWERQLDVEYHYGTPVLAGNQLITGGDLGKLAALDVRSGETLWHKSVLEAGYPSGLSVEGERIYASTPEGQVHCCNLQTGELEWSFQCTDDLMDMTPYRRGIRSILAKAILQNNQIIACGCDGVIYMLDAHSGQCVSKMRFNAPITAPPCSISNGFCIGTLDGRLYRFAV